MVSKNIIYLWFPRKNYKIGGMFAHVKGIISGFIDNDYTVTLITSSTNIPLTNKNLKVEFIENDSKWPYPFNMIAYTKKINPIIISKIKELNPEFIYHRYELYISIFEKIKNTQSKLLLEYNGSYVWVIKYWAKNLTKLGGLLLLGNIKTFERNQLINSSEVIVVSEPLKKHLITDYHIDENKILEVTNGYDPQIFFSKIKNQELIDKYNLKKKVIGFSGTFGPWHGTEILAKSIKLVLSKKQDVSFLFIGDGALKKNCEKITQEEGVSNNCIFVGNVPFSQMNDYLNLCDVLVNPTIENKDGTEFFGSPTKLFEYVGTERTIVTSNIGQMKGLFLDDEVYFVNPGDETDLSNKILAAMENPRKVENKEKYTWKAIAKDIISSIK